MRVKCLMLLMTEKRLMWVKGFYLQKPLIRRPIIANKFYPLIESLYLRQALYGRCMIAIDVFLLPHIRGLILFKLACLRRNRKWWIDISFPVVAFLSSIKFPCIVAIMVVRS